MDELELEQILEEIHSVSVYQDELISMVRSNKNELVRVRLLKEYDKAEEHYKKLSDIIKGIDPEKKR